MASYTGNLNLKKPALDDDALITDINNNMDILDAAVNGIQDGLAIVANGNTHVAITSGQFVYVRNHSTLTEGLYVASTNIAANATLSTSNLTADSAGGLNALNTNINQRFIFRCEYIEIQFTNGVGEYDLSAKLSAIGKTNANAPITSISGTASTAAPCVRASDILKDKHTLKVGLTTNYSGTVGCFVLFFAT